MSYRRPDFFQAVGRPHAIARDGLSLGRRNGVHFIDVLRALADDAPRVPDEGERRPEDTHASGRVGGGRGVQGSAR